MAESSAPASAEATNETPSGRWRLAGVVAGGLAVSAAVHVALVGTVLILGSRGGGPEPVKAVPVDVVTPDQLAAMEKPDPQPPAQPQIPDVASQPQPPAQAAAPQTQSVASPPSPSPPPSQPPPPQLDAFGPPIAPPPAPATSAPPALPPASSSGQATQLAQMLGLPTPVAGLGGGPPSEYKANLTDGEIAGFASHVQSCWTPPPASIKGANITVFIRVRLRRDGSLAGPPEPLGGSASMQALALLQNSLDALKKCPAYAALPADKYDEWRVLDLHFTPNGISTATPAPHARNAARPG